MVFLLIFLYSCSTPETNILHGYNYVVKKEDKKYQVDSFKVVTVIDNRKIKDSVIGDADYDKLPLIINRPLPDYLKMMFNTLISKDSSQKYFIPVTVYIDEFFSSRHYDFFSQCANFKFAYLFEYPSGSGLKSLRIEDSLNLCGDPNVGNQKRFLIDGIRETSKLFTSRIKTLPIQDTKGFLKNETTKNEITIDTINKKPERIFNHKYGVLFNYYTGFKDSKGIFLTYLGMANHPGLNTEIGVGYGFFYFDIHNNNVEANFYGLTTPIVYRYNLSDNLNGPFLNGLLTLAGGVEQTNTLPSGVFIGGRIEETVGLYLFNYFSISAGIYQQGYLFSKYLPYDLGFVFSLNITGGY
jgi:hypothetical protein